jgi:hypothetical protein
MAKLKVKKQSGWLRFLGFIFIWLVPLVYIGFIAIDISTTTDTSVGSGGGRIVFSVWALVILAILVLVYITQVRKRLTQVLHVSDVQGRPVPAFWRFIQLLEYASSFGMLIGGVFVIGQLSSVLYTFGIVSLISGTIGYTLLMLDSLKREKIYQEKKALGL